MNMRGSLSPTSQEAPVVTDIRSAPPTQRELVIASLLARR